MLAASLTAGLDASPGEDRAEGGLEAEARTLLHELRHLIAASSSQRVVPDC